MSQQEDYQPTTLQSKKYLIKRSAERQVEYIDLDESLGKLRTDKPKLVMKKGSGAKKSFTAAADAVAKPTKVDKMIRKNSSCSRNRCSAHISSSGED